MRKLVIICGPTATGKTSLALKLCQRFNGEIVSIDSRQVYKGADIGTGKEPVQPADSSTRPSRVGSRDRVGEKKPDGFPSAEFQIERGEDLWVINGVKIHLYDLIEPDEELNVVQFAKIAGPTIERIWARGKLPILVGGSGLYLEVLLGKVSVAKVPPDPELRARLEKLSKEELFEELESLDPEKAKTIDKNSPHRLMRAIEIAEGLKKAKKVPGMVEVLPLDLEPLWIGLNAPREQLYKWIDQRIDEMIEAGLLEEIQGLVEKHGWEVPALNSIGYIEFKPHFEEEATLEECITRAKFNTHAYARRQLTWFRRNKNIQWFDVTKENFDEEVERLVESYLENGF